MERENGRYWLADPEGNAFLSTGLDCINPGEGTRLSPVLPFVGEKEREDYRKALAADESAGAGNGQSRNSHEEAEGEHMIFTTTEWRI